MAATIKGINVLIGAETTGLSKALSDVNKKSRDIASELRQVERGLKFNPNDTILLAQKQKLLGDQVANTREKLDRLKAAQAQVNEQFRRGEISEGQYRAFQREIVETESKLKHFEQQLASTQKNMANFGKSMQDAGKKMTDAGKNLTMKVTAPVVGLGAVIAKTGMDFEAAMSEVGAISGATGSDLQALEAIAKEMGATTKFSASEAASGLKYMAMAGWDTQQMLDGLPGVLNLAAAAGEDLGLVSDIVTDAMTAFSMEAKQAGEFADTLAAASSSANTNVAMLGESFKYVAPVAGALGFSAKDTSIALSLMANAGIKGSQSGTALRTMMTNLAKPTDQMQKAMTEYGISLTNADGSMKSLDQVMLNLRESLGGLTEAEQAAAAATIFGKEAMSGALAIVNASEADFNKLSDAINNSAGAADRMAKEMQDNLKGRLTELKSAIEGVSLQLYEAMLPAMEKTVAIVQRQVDWFAKLSPEMKVAIIAIAGLAAAIGPLLIVAGLAASGLGAILGVLPVLGAAFTALTGPVGLAITGIAAAAYGITKLVSHLKSDAIPAVDLFGDEVSEATQKAVGGFLDLEKDATTALDQLNWSGQKITGEMASELTGKFDDMKNQIVGKVNEQKTEAVKALNDMFSQSTSMTDEEKAKILDITTSKYNEQIKKTEEGNQKINEILKAAKEDGKGITDERRKVIAEIQEEMKNDAIRILSESEEEQKAILRRLELESGKITARQAAEVVKNSLEQKEKTIENAETEYKERIKIANRLREEGTEEARKAADEIEAEAKRQKEETIAHAKEMHQRVVEEAKAQAQEHVNQVDWETGQIKTKWQMFMTGISGIWGSIRDAAANTWNSMASATSTAWGRMKDDITSTANGIKDTTTKIWNDLKTAVVNTTINLKTDTIAKFEEIWSYLKSIPTQATTWGKNIIDGLWDGIRNSLSSFKANFTNWVNDGVVGTVKSVLSIRSPSQVMHQFGVNVAEGLANGIEAASHAPIAAAANMASAIIDQVNAAKEAMNSIGGNMSMSSKPVYNVDERVERIAKKDHDAIVDRGTVIAQNTTDQVRDYYKQLDKGDYDQALKRLGYAEDNAKQVIKMQNSGDQWSQDVAYEAEKYWRRREGTYGFTNAEELLGWIEEEREKIRNLPRAADGGIATKATLGIWGEAGAEALLPLVKLQPMMADALLNAISAISPSQAIDYDKLGAAIAKHVKPSVTQHNTFNSPDPLTPSETARQNLRVSRQLAMEWGL